MITLRSNAMPASLKILWTVVVVIVLLQFALWRTTREDRARWPDIPPAPTVQSARIAALGDAQLAYRTNGLMLQNFGSTGGRDTPLRDYDFNALSDWLFLEHALDARSDFAPFLGAFYFGAIQDPAKLRILIEYLKVAGAGNEPGKWRWLAHAVYLALNQVKDLTLAHELAVTLSARNDPTMPIWARQMPAFVMEAQGNKAGSYEFMMNILKGSVDTLPPEEINYMVYFICERVLTPAQAKTHELCIKKPD